MANRRVTSNSERENNVLSKQAIVLIGSLRILAPFQRAKLLVKQQVERGRLLQGRGGPALVRREHQRVGRTRWSGEYRFFIIAKISFAPRLPRRRSWVQGETLCLRCKRFHHFSDGWTGGASWRQAPLSSACKCHTTRT